MTAFHYSDVIRTPWCFKSDGTQCFVQQHVQVNIKVTIKASHNWIFVKESPHREPEMWQVLLCHKSSQVVNTNHPLKSPINQWIDLHWTNCIFSQYKICELVTSDVNIYSPGKRITIWQWYALVGCCIICHNRDIQGIGSIWAYWQ